MHSMRRIVTRPAVVLFPTPPLPDATAITCCTWCKPSFMPARVASPLAADSREPTGGTGAMGCRSGYRCNACVCNVVFREMG